VEEVATLPYGTHWHLIIVIVIVIINSGNGSSGGISCISCIDGCGTKGSQKAPPD
jgi:hypothetical protein